MKKITLVILAVLLSVLTINAQTVNDMPIKDLKAEYIQILGKAKFMSKKVTITMDFGQQVSMFAQGNMVIKDSLGNTKVFNSMVDALNFLYEAGYEFVTAYTITVGNQNVYHYLLRKKD